MSDLFNTTATNNAINLETARCVVWSETIGSEDPRGHRSREEVLNVRLADLLLSKGLNARPEIVLRRGKRLPDIIVDQQGVRIIIEARSSKNNLLSDTRARVESGVCPVAIGLLYPPHVRDADDIADALFHAKFDIDVVYYDRTGLRAVHQSNLSLDDLATSLTSARSLQVSADLTTYHVDRVRDVIDDLVKDGIRDVDPKASAPLANSLAQRLGLSPKNRLVKLTDELLRIAVFILFDAMVYQDAVASQHPDLVENISVQTLDGRRNSLVKNWDAILAIDYEPIFRIAREIVDIVPNTFAWNQRLETLAIVAANVRGSGVLAKHDFMGRLFHRILLRTAGESYATYYTALPSAYLAARIAIGLSSASFNSIDAVRDLRIGDLACGSGTLLSATYTAIRDRYVAESSATPHLDELHKHLIEDVIYGLDVLDYAAHLTLTTLALHRDRQPLISSNIWRVPTGYDRRTGVHLGSLDLYFQVLTGLTFGEQEQSKTLRGDKAERVNLPNFDLLIMNPPFSRSSGPKITFGYDLPNKPLLMQRMKQIAKEQHFRKMLVAGMGAFFVPLAIRYLKEGGRTAFILPRALLSGVAWEEVRKIVEASCHLELVISNFDPGHIPVLANGKNGKRTPGWALSEETTIGEILFIARKRTVKAPNEQTRFVNIFEFPENEYEAISMADQVLAHFSSNRDGDLTYDRRTVGTSYSVGQSSLERFNWLFPCVFAARDLNRIVSELIADKNVEKFSQFATSFGCDISAEKQAFEKSTVQTAYPILWTHGIAQETMDLDATHIGFGTPKGTADRASRLFNEKSARLLIAERPHLKTTSTFSIVAPYPVLATPFWEIRLKDASLTSLVSLWLNSTYGILILLASATSSQGEIFKLKNEQLRNLRILNFNKIDRRPIEAFLQAHPTLRFDNLEESWREASLGRGLRFLVDNLFAKYVQRSLAAQDYALLASDPIVTHRRR